MEEPDSDLVIIDDEEELEFLRNRTAELSADRDWWIGECGLVLFIFISLEGREGRCYCQTKFLTSWGKKGWGW